MATLFYSLSGEGRGHATSVRSIVEGLRRHHRIVIYAPGQACELLQPVYQGSDVTVRHIPGLAFHYTRSHRLNPVRTGIKGLSYATKYAALSRRLRTDIETEAPDLVVTDFESALPRAARRAGVPFISLDHQHVLLTSDLSSLPMELRWHAFFMAQIVRGFFHGQMQTVVSSFYFPPLKPRAQDVTQIGVLLRSEVLEATPERGDRLVVYLRRFGSPEVFRVLEACGARYAFTGWGRNRLPDVCGSSRLTCDGSWRTWRQAGR